MNKAKKHEKEYNWLQAAEHYKQASDLAFEEKKELETAELHDLIGFCFYRAAFQAENRKEFKKQILRSIREYQKAIGCFQTVSKKKNIKVEHLKATITYLTSWTKSDLKEKVKLLFKWWKVENKILEDYRKSGNKNAIGRVCNNIINFAKYELFWLCTDWEKRKEIINTSIRIGEKAIKIFSELKNHYELAKAYCFTSWYCGWVSFHQTQEEEGIAEATRKAIVYFNKALKLAEETKDAWLIASANNAALVSAWWDFDPESSLKYGTESLKYGLITKDNYQIGYGKVLNARSVSFAAQTAEDPDEQRKAYRKAIKWSKESIKNFQTMTLTQGLLMSRDKYMEGLNGLASIETDGEKKRSFLELSIRTGRSALRKMKYFSFLRGFGETMASSLFALARIEKSPEQKRKLLFEALRFCEKAEKRAELHKTSEIAPISLFGYSGLSAALLTELSKLTTNSQEKISFINQAFYSMKKCIEEVEKQREQKKSRYSSELFGQHYFAYARVLEEEYSLKKESEILERAIKAYSEAGKLFQEAEMVSHVAESYWQIARLHNNLNEYSESASYYQRSAEKYKAASVKTPQLKNFYVEYSLYMQAWSQIEEARHSHSIEDYDRAKLNYEKTAKLHESTEAWRYLASNYFAWAKMEEAESLSRKENTQQAKEIFQKALEQFSTAEKSFKQKIGEVISEEERDLNQKLLQASDLRRRFCQARIQIEDAKLLDRQGKYLQSSQSYKEAAENILSTVEKVESEVERKEMGYLGTLCQAWGKMAIAEETTSSESYLEAAGLFEQAKEHCYTRKASLWALGNINFCRGLAAGVQYQTRLDLAEHTKAKGYMKNASTNYLQAGFKAASEYARATQRLFDAYLVMNQAEREADQEKRAKQYQVAESLLQVSVGSFMKAKQPEKATQVQQLLKTVREEKALALSLNEVLHAPTITSSTLSFAAPTSTSEASVGLEKFEHANVQANLIAGMKEVKVGESFCLSIEFVNAGKEPALLTRVKDFVPPDFIVVKKPEIYRLEESCLNMKGKQIAPLKLVEAKVVLQPSKKGVYHLSPVVHYLDELGQNKSLQLKSVEIKVEEIILSDRISTGTRELDSLLLGGIPKEYAVVLTGPPSDERELLINNFLEAGVKEGQTSFYVTTEAVGIEEFLEKSGFYLFLCNPKPKVEIPDLPNIIKLRSKTDLTNLNIALLKAYRNVGQSSEKRICLDLVSDVLVDYGVKTTRNWLSELITDLGSKGFTVLAVLDSGMHTSEEANAIAYLFDGEISLYQTEGPLESRKSIRIKKLRNQDYIKNPICLTT